MTNNQVFENFDDLLEYSLTQLEAGVPLADLLAQAGSQAAELQPLLEMASELNELTEHIPVPPPDASLARLLAHGEKLGAPLPVPWTNWFLLTLGVATMGLVLLSLSQVGQTSSPTPRPSFTPTSTMPHTPTTVISNPASPFSPHPTFTLSPTALTVPISTPQPSPTLTPSPTTNSPTTSATPTVTPTFEQFTNSHPVVQTAEVQTQDNSADCSNCLATPTHPVSDTNVILPASQDTQATSTPSRHTEPQPENGPTPNNQRTPPPNDHEPDPNNAPPPNHEPQPGRDNSSPPNNPEPQPDRHNPPPHNNSRDSQPDRNNPPPNNQGAPQNDNRSDRQRHAPKQESPPHNSQ